MMFVRLYTSPATEAIAIEMCRIKGAITQNASSSIPYFVK